MKKLTCFIIGFLLVAVVVLSVAVGYLFTEENGELSVGPIPSPATSSAQTEPSEVLENEGSNKFEDSSIVPKDEITEPRCLDIDLGHIGIDDQQYAGTHQHQDIDNQAEKSISAYCTMGSVSILFSEPNRRGFLSMHAKLS